MTSKPYAYRDVEWHYGPNVRRTESDDDPQGHGSCVASKAAGWKTGVSKNSRLVVMKSSHSLQDITFAFFTAFEDIMAKSREKKAVVLYPRTSLRTFVDDSHLRPEWDFLSTIILDMRYPGIPWAGASAVKCLGIPHQKSTYMVWPPNAPSNKQYGYIYESHIAYSYEYPLMVLVFEFFCLRNQ